MAIRVGILGIAHLHVWSYVDSLKKNPKAELTWVFDHDPKALAEFAKNTGLQVANSIEHLLENVDAVAVVSENAYHRKYACAALQARKPTICEKPLAITVEDAEAMVAASKESGAQLMTAFPCRFSPTWTRTKEKVLNGDIGKIVGIAATNRGQCPGGWFVDKELSGGGAMIDHTVHVADLLRDLLSEAPNKVGAQINSNRYGESWDDSAMVSLDYPGGVFATLDSSWSRPRGFYTWGDVTMKIVGEAGVIEMDMFNQAAHQYDSEKHTSHGYGTNPDYLMFDEFLNCILEKRQPLVTGEHGLEAVKVATAAYAATVQNAAVLAGA